MGHRFGIAAVLFVTAIASASHVNAEDQAPPAVQNTPLLSTGTTVMGETLHYPTTGPAHVTAGVVTLAPGSHTILHKHGVPLFGYVLEGEITVDYGQRGKRTYRQGEALMEAMDTAHFGADVGAQPVRILTVYMGAEGAPPDVIPVQP